MKSLRIPKGKSISVNRRTDSTMAKRKKAKGQATIYKTLHRNQKIEKLGWTQVLTSGIRRVTLGTNRVIRHEWEKESVYDKWNISVVICDTDIPQRITKSSDDLKLTNRNPCVASFLAENLCQRNSERRHKLWNIW